MFTDSRKRWYLQFFSLQIYTYGFSLRHFLLFFFLIGKITIVIQILRSSKEAMCLPLTRDVEEVRTLTLSFDSENQLVG